MQIWREIREKGYLGTYRLVSKWMSKLRHQGEIKVDQQQNNTKIEILNPANLPPAATDKIPSAR